VESQVKAKRQLNTLQEMVLLLRRFKIEGVTRRRRNRSCQQARWHPMVLVLANSSRESFGRRYYHPGDNRVSAPR
jgi:hypothetical protein